MAQEQKMELRKIEFTKSLRGYACGEVDTYLAYVNDRYGQVCRECSDLRKKMAAMAAGQNEYREDALREKEKMQAEIDAMRDEQRRMTEEAKRKAARILADAEAAAAGILKDAEDRAKAAEAEAMERLEREETEKRTAAERQIAERNNAADRLVQEIDSFREEVFAMYARHIEELERLAGLTDGFYHTKEELAGDVPAYAMPEEAEAAAEDMTADAPDAEETEEVLDDDLLRIDWKKHRAGRDSDEVSAGDDAEADSADLWENAAENTGTDETDEWDTAEDAEPEWEEPALPAAEERHGSMVSLQELVIREPDEEFEELWEETEEYAEPADEEEPDEEDFLPAGEEYEPAGEAYEPEEEAEGPFDEHLDEDEEDFLARLKDKYPVFDGPAVESAAPEEDAKPERTPKNIDDFLEDQKEVHLTGEFDKIYSSEKSASIVAAIEKQPLVAAQKPDKNNAKLARKK